MTRQTQMIFLVMFAALISGLFSGCSTDESESKIDMGAGDMTQSSDTTTTTEDSAQSIDVGGDTTTLDTSTGTDSSSGDMTQGCEGDCAQMNLVATFGETTTQFDRAHYGLNAPSVSGSGEWEIYVEAYSGGEQGCPSESSPTPAQTLIVSGTIAQPPNTDGIRGVLFDFEELLTLEPLLRTDSATGMVVDADLCLDECLDAMPPRDPDGFVALDVDLMFPGGTIAGHIYATHCDSLDSLSP